MSIPLTINGAVFNYPVSFDTNWGIDATGWAQAVTNGMLQKAGGSFPLTAEVNFGSSFGLVSPYYKSSTANIASAGVIRLAKTDTMAWRNNANSADLPLGIDGSNNLTFNGSTLSFTGAVNPGTQFQLAYYAATGNAVSGLALITANRALQSDANGLPTASSVPSSTLAFLDATSSVQTQLNSISTIANAALPRAGGTMSGAINMGSQKVTNLASSTTSGDAIAYGQSGWSLAAGSFTAPVDMGSNKITSVANGTASNDAAAFGQVPTVTDWVAYTPTISGFGTTTLVSFYWRRTGNNIFVKGTFVAGTLAATTAMISVPSGTINFAKLPSSNVRSTYIGSMKAIRTTSFAPDTIVAVSSDLSTTAVGLSTHGTAGSILVFANGQDLGDSNDYFMVIFDYPV